MRIKLFESFNDDIDLDKIEQDFNDILVELKDDPKFEIEFNSFRDGIHGVIWIKISKLGFHNSFLVEYIKDYLDMMVDYMDINYDYEMKFNYLAHNSGSWKFYDNYDLHLKQKVTKIWIEFSHRKIR